MSHQETITHFYDAFARWDAEAMAACYADDVRFSDAVFQDLRGKDASDMWRMLCSRAKGDLKVEVSNIKADSDTGTAHWDATYHFGPNKRLVVNRIDAAFRFNAGGLIMEHRDTFDLYAWSKQALGVPGLLLGWSGFMQGQVRSQAMAGLRSFQKKGR